MTKGEHAAATMAAGYNCAQSVLVPFCDELGIEKERALKMACGFGAGMARKEEVCGAVTGGILVLGAKYGRGESDGRPATETTYAKTRELMSRFEGRHGTCICRNLLGGCDLTTEAGQAYYKENDLGAKVCNPCVQTAVGILQDIL